MDSSIFLSPLTIFLYFLIYGAIHTILASVKVKEFLKRIIKSDQYYRFIYNIIAVLLLIPILMLALILPDQIIYSVDGIIADILSGVRVFSILAILIAVWQTGLLKFLGLAHDDSTPHHAELQTSGLYNFIRHPIYTFTMLFFWATPTMTINLLALSLAVTLYSFIGSNYEEKKLVDYFGEQYTEYQNSVNRFIPKLF